MHKLLADTASSEFLFSLDFWEDEGVFKELFGPVVAVVEGDLSEQLQVSRAPLKCNSTQILWSCGTACCMCTSSSGLVWYRGCI